MSKKIGFIGLGTMGGPMSQNLMKAGHSLTVYDINGEALESAIASGAIAVSSPKEVSQGVDILICMLPASQHVISAAYGENGFLAGLKKGTVVIDMSTIDPGTTRSVYAHVKEAGCEMLDAPVSGSSAGAISGTLTIMVGGDKAIFDEQNEILSAMGTNIIHCGAIGMGETVKLANNLVAAVSMAAVSEAFALAQAKGADAQVLFDVISKSSGNCWALQTRCPAPGVVPDSPSTNDYAPGFMTKLMQKDLGLALTAANEANVPLYMGALVRELYATTSNMGYSDSDFSAISKLYG